MARLAKVIVAIAVAIFISGYVFFAFWQHLAEKISMNLRAIYLQALLKQEISFFESIKVEEIPT